MLSSIPLGDDELPGNKKLAEELSHLGEIGSLLNPSEGEIDELKVAAANCSDDLFASATKTKLENAAAICEKLSRRFTCTVANPPYMGSSSFNPFMSKWVKKNYSDVKSDLCTCFIERGFSLAKDRGYAAMVTMQSWMFLGSFEKIRAKVIDNKTIVSMAHLGPRAFDAIGGEVVNVTADVIYNGRAAYEGAYVRLVDINGSEAKRLKLVEAIQNPACGWFYRRDADTFKQIPGTPIAYWASDRFINLFSDLITRYSVANEGIKTGDNDRFLKYWFEVSECQTNIRKRRLSPKWHITAKAGESRKWYGSHYVVTNFANNGAEMIATGHASITGISNLYKPAITWNRIGSGRLSFRYLPAGFLSNMGGLCMYSQSGQGDSQLALLSFLNSSIVALELEMLNPSTSFPPGTINSIGCGDVDINRGDVKEICSAAISQAMLDWDSFETSWDFKRHPLL